MAWRLRHKAWQAGRGAANRAALQALVQSGKARGALALVGDDAVGWCSAAPRADFEGLAAKPSLATDWDARTWSVTCFFLARGWRGRGLAKQLLNGAVELARSEGATRIEGYPAPLPKQGGRLPATFAWTGVAPVFESCGFRLLAEPPGKRPIYVRNLRPPRRGA